MPRKLTKGRPKQDDVAIGSILQRIDALPPRARLRLFRYLSRYPEYEETENWWIHGAASAMLSSYMKRSHEEIRRLEHERDRLESDKAELDEEIANRIPKRSMTACNRETLQHYFRLCQEHKKQINALRMLITLPSEQSKNYVLKYQDSCRRDPEGIGDMETVRQHIKRLRSTAQKRR